MDCFVTCNDYPREGEYNCYWYAVGNSVLYLNRVRYSLSHSKEWSHSADGAHIGLLIMAALYHLCPGFIREGRLAWLRAPLYIVKSGKKNHYYFTDAEYEKNKIKGEVSRAKGIGSLSPDQAKEALFGKNQRLELLIPDEDTLPLLASLMGDDVQFRKNYIFNNVDFSKISE